jgi:hypothetical protein
MIRQTTFILIEARDVVRPFSTPHPHTATEIAPHEHNNFNTRKLTDMEQGAWHKAIWHGENFK